MNSLYRFCSEPPELSGSLICSYLGNDSIHSDYDVVTRKDIKSVMVTNRSVQVAWAIFVRRVLRRKPCKTEDTVSGLTGTI